MKAIHYFLAAATLAASSTGFSATVTGVIDGDTILIKTGKSDARQVDLAYIDAPELGQPFGERSKRALERVLLNKSVSAVEVVPRARPDPRNVKTDPPGPPLVAVKAGGMDVNTELIKWGYAWSTEPRYNRIQAFAKSKKRGLWKDDDPVHPLQWRQQTAATEKEKAARREWEAEVAAFEPNHVNEVVRSSDEGDVLYIYRPRRSTTIRSVPMHKLGGLLQSQLNSAGNHQHRKELAEATGRYHKVIIADY